MHTDIILLDIPSTLRYPVSPHTWKVRYVISESLASTVLISMLLG